MAQEDTYLISMDKMLTRPCKPPVDRTYLDRVQKDLYETIKKAEESWDPSVPSLESLYCLSTRNW
jgi:hypothetical protein